MINTGNKVKPSASMSKDEEGDFEREIEMIDAASTDNQAANMSMHKRKQKKHEESAGEKFYRSLQPNQQVTVPEQLFATKELERLNKD